MTTSMTMAGAINQALALEMESDPDVLLLGVDIGIGTFAVTRGLQDRFGKKRVRDTPISESAVIGTAAGAAATGLRPVAELMFVDFIGVAMDQIFNQAAKMKYMFGGKAKIPMVIRSNCGAGLGAAAQHSQSLESFFMHMPGVKVIMPSTPYDAKGLLISAIRDDNPVVFLEPKKLYYIEGELPEESYTIPLGQADIKREGTDVTVVTTGSMVSKVLQAADSLNSEGIDVEVVDPRTLLPLDEEAILKSVEKTNRLVIVHEEVQFAGSGAEIAAIVANKGFDYLDAPIARIGAPFCPVPFSSKLEEAFIPGVEKIISTVKDLMDY